MVQRNPHMLVDSSDAAPEERVRKLQRQGGHMLDPLSGGRVFCCIFNGAGSA